MMCKEMGPKAKLSACCFGVAFGVTKGLFMMLLAWSGWLFGYGIAMIDHVGSFYCGYAPSFVGGLLGGLWGLVGGFAFGFVAAYVYNYCVCYCMKCCSTDSKDGSK